MTRTDLRNMILRETAHCKTHDEMVDELVRFIVTNFKMRKVVVVVDDPPTNPRGKKK